MARATKLENNLKSVRLARGLTQQQLAEKLSVTRQTLNAIELGKYSPTLELAFLLARQLEVNLEDLFSYPE